MTAWQLFIATFFSLDFVISLSEFLGLAFLLAFTVRLLPFLSLYMEKKTGVPGFSEEDFSVIKGVVYLGVGLLTLFNMFAASTAGLFYFSIFLETTIMWLASAYLLVAVIERKCVSLKEFRDFIFPYFYVWGKNREVKKPVQLKSKEGLKILIVVFVIVLFLYFLLFSTFS